MNQRTLVAAHLSSLFTSSAHVTTHAVPTSRRDIPLATAQIQSNFPDGHASHSSLFHSTLTGHVLLRVVQGGLAVELISLATSVPPIRYVFPAPVLPSPSLVLWQDCQLHLLAVTAVGSLHRIVLPIYEGSQLWHEPLRQDWCREWQIKRLGGSYVNLVHVQDFHSLALGLSNGGILRLDADFIDEEQFNEQWSETEFRLSSWYTSFLPALPTGLPQSSDVVCLASLPPPTDITDVFSFSRDRVLRHWTVSKGCRAEITLSHAGPSTGEKFSTLLESGPQKLLQVYSKGGKVQPADSAQKSKITEDGITPEQHIVLVFIPTPSSATAGGNFQWYCATGSQFLLTDSYSCSRTSAHWKMQDFLLSEDILYVLWERQGQTMVEMTQYVDGQEPIWETATYAQDNELTQASLDELLLLPGSLADKFLQAILRPSVFSTLTLHGALKEYTEHHLSLAGPHPAPLLASYATLSEHIAAVVGCTVKLTHDIHTGVAQYRQYWNALRRDWEGFIARCREVERSARWPLALGVESKGQPIIIERERIGRSVLEDTPLRLHRSLTGSSPIEPSFALLDTCWVLRTKLNPKLMRQIENEILNILSQEFAFPLVDIIIEASNRVFSRDDLDEGLESWVITRFAVVGDIDPAIRTVLDIIGGFDKVVKQEEEEVELIIPPPTSEWSRALVTTYVSESADIRYNLCLTLAIALFFLGDDLADYDPALLAEVFAVFRGVAMLRFLCRQPAGDLDGTQPSAQDSTSSDDVVTRLSNMHMSRGVRNPKPTYSLIHRLLTQSGHGSTLPAAAHHFMDQTGLLSTVTPAHATKSEVLICERLRLLGYREVAKSMLAWLPRTPSVTYVLGRLWLETGRADESALVLQGVAGSFGPDSALSDEDHQALASVLPTAQLFPSEFHFYLHVAELFRAASFISYEVLFSKLALSVIPEGVDAAELWANIIKGYTDLGLYEDAYTAIVMTPYDKLKHHCVGQLVYKMCDDNVIDRLMSLNFCGLAKEVEESLSFKARNADPRVRPFYAQILYTWYVQRGDYRNAAMTMYLRARKLSELQGDLAQLSELQGDPAQLVSLAEQEVEALAVSMNALSIIEAKSAWIVVPMSPTAREPRKRRKLNNHIPEDKVSIGQRDVDVVTLSDIQHEYTLLNARLELLWRDPSLLRNGELSLSAWVTVSKLTQAGLFDLAMYTARTLAVDMSELFQRLAVQCLRLSATPDPSLLEVASDWLLTDKVSSWPGTAAERGWRYLRQSLERNDAVETDFKYSKSVLDTLLSHDRASAPPPWLVQSLEEHHPEHLIRACLRYDLLEEALDHTLTLLRKANAASSRVASKQASNTWLPYTLIDAVLKAAEEETAPSTRTQSLRGTLQSEVTSRINRVQRQSEKAH